MAAPPRHVGFFAIEATYASPAHVLLVPSKLNPSA